jgi:guanylate kinase
MKRKNPPFLVLSATSGAGKTTIAKELVRRNRNMVISVSATTRPRRVHEKEGKDYYFMKKEEFEENITLNNFIEYEQVHSWYYGTLKHVIESQTGEGKIVLFDIDVKGALSIKGIYPNSILVFIKAPSLKELKRRLRGRKSDSPEEIQMRLERLDYEYEQAKKFDFIVINKDLEQTVIEIESLI